VALLHCASHYRVMRSTKSATTLRSVVTVAGTAAAAITVAVATAARERRLDSSCQFKNGFKGGDEWPNLITLLPQPSLGARARRHTTVSGCSGHRHLMPCWGSCAMGGSKQSMWKVAGQNEQASKGARSTVLRHWWHRNTRPLWPQSQPKSTHECSLF